jgi:hypothetical protein
MCKLFLIKIYIRGQLRWCMSVIPDTQEAEIGRIAVQQFRKICISPNKPGLVICVCNPAMWEV